MNDILVLIDEKDEDEIIVKDAAPGINLDELELFSTETKKISRARFREWVHSGLEVLKQSLLSEDCSDFVKYWSDLVMNRSTINILMREKEYQSTLHNLNTIIELSVPDRAYVLSGARNAITDLTKRRVNSLKKNMETWEQKILAFLRAKLYIRDHFGTLLETLKEEKKELLKCCKNHDLAQSWRNCTIEVINEEYEAQEKIFRQEKDANMENLSKKKEFELEQFSDIQLPFSISSIMSPQLSVFFNACNNYVDTLGIFLTLSLLDKVSEYVCSS